LLAARDDGLDVGIATLAREEAHSP